MRWIASIVVALCLVGAGALRPAHAAHRTGEPRSKLSTASHLVKAAPRRCSVPAPEQRLASFTLVAAPEIAAPLPRMVWRLVSTRPLPHVAAFAATRSSRGPPPGSLRCLVRSDSPHSRPSLILG